MVSGSLSATGYEAGLPSHEGMPFYPFDRHLPYGFTKHLAEHEALRAHADGLNVVVATSCAIVGPHDYKPSRFGRVLIDYAHGRLKAYIPGGFEFVSARDIAEGHVLAMRKGRSGQKYIFSTAYASVDELMSLYERVTGRPPPRLRLPAPIMARWRKWPTRPGSGCFPIDRGASPPPQYACSACSAGRITGRQERNWAIVLPA